MPIKKICENCGKLCKPVDFDDLDLKEFTGEFVICEKCFNSCETIDQSICMGFKMGLN
jgi:hypothetical protein